MLLNDKVAVIYGAGGGVGGAIARTFAREGAKLFLAGRRRASLDNVAADVTQAGGTADVAEVDAFDESSVERHLAAIVGRAGRIDVLFNAIGIANTRVQGKPLTDLAVEDFLQPIAGYARGYFLTARLAARQMIKKGSGVVMTATAVPSRAGIPLVGGFAPAEAAVEALTRSLSAELGPHGIRVVGLRADAMPETATIREVFSLHAQAHGMSWDQFHELIASKNHRRRLPTLAELAEVAAFMASDRASAVTATAVNLSIGMLDD